MPDEVTAAKMSDAKLVAWLRVRAADEQRAGDISALNALPTDAKISWERSTNYRLAADRLAQLAAERDCLRQAIEHVLADEESGPGGWGPDVTMVGVLREALAGTAPSQLAADNAVLRERSSPEQPHDDPRRRQDGAARSRGVR